MRTCSGPSCRWLLIAAFATTAGGFWRCLPAAAAAQEEPGVQPIAALERQVAALRVEAHAHPGTPQIWGSLGLAEAVLERRRAIEAAHGAPLDEAALQERLHALNQHLLDEWKQAAPGDATPYLVEMRREVAPDRQDDYVLGLLERFPDDRQLLGRALPILIKREEVPRAAGLVDGALERHPELPEAWSQAIRFYREQQNSARVRELATRWLDRMPDSSAAFGEWLRSGGPASDPGAAKARLERLLGSGTIDTGRVDLCSQLLDYQGGALREAAQRCLADAVEHAADPELRTRAAALSLAARGAPVQPADLARLLAALPPAKRPQALLTAVAGLAADACEARLALLRLLPWDGSEAGGACVMPIADLFHCQTYGPARDYFLAALQGARASDVPQVVSAWFAKVNGSYGEDHGLGPHMVAALEERLRRQPQEDGLWRALAAAYEIAGLDARRAAHLQAWLAAKAGTPSPEDVLWLAEYQADHAEPPSGAPAGGAGVAEPGPRAALATLRQAWQQRKDERTAMALGDLLVANGRPDELAALAEETASDADPRTAGLAHLLRARALLAAASDGDGAGERLLAEYRAYFEQVPSAGHEPATEYLALVAALRGPAQAAETAQRLCARDGVRGLATPADCAARMLEQQGHAARALALLEAAANRSPDDLPLQLRFAQMAAEAGLDERAERAYRRALALDPESEPAFVGLARLAEKRGSLADLESVLAEAERARGGQPGEVILSMARALRQHGQARRAIELLQVLRERMPGWLAVDGELRSAYAALAREPQATVARDLPAAAAPGAPPIAEVAPAVAVAAVAVAAPGSPAATAPADLAAIRDADAWLLGLGRQVDQTKARELTTAQARRGSAYANVRLALFQQAGVLGLTANPRQAAATASPYLPAVRAAAEGGEPYAQYLWGTVLLRGVAVPQRPAEAAVWLRRAAERGEPWAEHNLAWMLWAGEGLPKDQAAAVQWFRRAAEARNVWSMTALAQAILEADPAPGQPAEGIAWLERAAERGHPPAVAWWAARQLYGVQGAAPDPERARPWLERAAALGEERGLFDLAAALLTASGGPEDAGRAVKLLTQAAAGGSPRSMIQLMWQSALGLGAPRDGRQAAEWSERAAARGLDDYGVLIGASPSHPAAFRRYFHEGLARLEQRAAAGDAFAGGLAARLYYMAVGVNEDDARALALARSAAAGGSAEAMRILGSAYRKGIGIERDAEQAAAWWRRGAEHGNGFCMMWYSQMLFRGEAGRTDKAEALSWLERAGEHGNAWAVGDLGRLYDEGWYDLPRDEKKAAYWKRKALAFGNNEARGWLIAHGLDE